MEMVKALWFRVGRTTGCLLLALGALAVVACDEDDEPDRAPQLANLDAEGERMVERFFDALQTGEVEQVDEVLAPGFVIVRANGSVHDRDSYLANLPEVNDYELDNFQASQSGEVVVVSYQTAVEEVVEGSDQPAGKAPRLSTFQWVDGEWDIVSHANFGAINPGR
jgi:hypothetical protein